MVLYATNPRLQVVPIPTGQEVPLSDADGAVEIHVLADSPTADQPVCRIVVLQQMTASAQESALPGELVGDRSSWSALSQADEEEPTWEDAAWQ